MIKLYPRRLMAITTLIALFNSGCTSLSETEVYSATKIKNTQSIYQDALFLSYSQQPVETEQEIFALTPEIKKIIRQEVNTQQSFHTKVHDLIDVIFSKEQIGLAYLNSASLTASQTYLNKQANCLSLTILAYALADELNIPVQFQEIKVPEYWISNNGYNLIAGHVNVEVSDNVVRDLNGFTIKPDTVTIDFDPYTRKKNFKTKNLSKKQIIAYFYTNKAAQALIDKKQDLAYAYLKKATTLAPEFSSAWGNLGVLYKSIGQYELAISSYEQAIATKPKNYTAINNLSFVLNHVGRVDEANVIREKLHNIRISNPYYHAFLGNKAYGEHDFELSETHFKKAIQLDGKQHEFHFGLAKSFAAQKRNKLAYQTLEKAIKVSPFYDVDQRYIAKLNLLNEAIIN